MATAGRIRGLVLSLGCIAGCTGYPPQEPITDARLEELRSRLEGNSPRERVAAAAELAGTQDRRAIGVLIDALDHGERGVRAAAAEALVTVGPLAVTEIAGPTFQGSHRLSNRAMVHALNVVYRIGDKSIPSLVECLKDGYPDTLACFIVPNFGDRAVKYLLKAAKSRDWEDKRHLISCLGVLGFDDRAVQALGDLLTQDAREDVREHAALALGQTGSLKAFPFLLRGLSDTSGVRWGAACGLGLLRNRDAVSRLIEVLRTDEDRIVRGAAASALGRIGDLRAIPALEEALKDPNIAGEMDPLVSLIQLGRRELLPRVIARLRGEEKMKAVQALVELRDRRAVKPLIRALKDKDAAYEAVRSLGRIGDPEAVEPILRLLRERPEPSTAREAVLALGRLRDSRAVASLVEMVRDDDDDRGLMPGWAASALGEIGDKSATVTLISALKADNAWLQWHAASALGEIGDLSATEALRAALKDPAVQVRVAAERALRNLGSSGNPGTHPTSRETGTK